MASLVRFSLIKHAVRRLHTTNRILVNATSAEQASVPATKFAFRSAPVVSYPARPVAETAAAPEATVLTDFSTKEFSDEFVASMCREPFPKEVTDILLAPLNLSDVATKPGFGSSDPLPYLPEIKYRRILNLAFGPGGWALVPRGVVSKVGTTISRDYALFARGRLVSQARGQQEVTRGKGAEMALEGVKSNALMRCCKDLGIASELWDPTWVKEWKKKQSSAGTRAPARK